MRFRSDWQDIERNVGPDAARELAMDSVSVERANVAELSEKLRMKRTPLVVTGQGEYRRGYTPQLRGSLLRRIWRWLFE